MGRNTRATIACPACLPPADPRLCRLCGGARVIGAHAAARLRHGKRLAAACAARGYLPHEAAVLIGVTSTHLAACQQGLKPAAAIAALVTLVGSLPRRRVDAEAQLSTPEA